MAYVAYVRVSTDQQADSGLSLESQESKIRAMATVKGVELLEVIVDAAESGKDLKRPGVQRILAMTKAKQIDGVIIAKLDRLTRSVRDACSLVELFEKNGVALLSLAESLDTTTAVGRMMLNVIAAFAQMEREVGVERTRAALQQKKKRGERTGTIPYGFRQGFGDKMERDAAESDVILRIQQLNAHGGSYRSIAAALNAEGLFTRSGTPWEYQYVANILGKRRAK